MTDKPMSAERLRHIKDHYERWGEAALERTCGELLAEIDRRGAALDDGELFKNIQRVLDEHSAWIARPSNDVTKAIAIVAGIWGSRYAEAAERQRDEALAALEKARADALEEAAKIVGPKGERPCDCDSCYCGNHGDMVAVAAWDADAFNAKAIRSLKDQTP